MNLFSSHWIQFNAHWIQLKKKMKRARNETSQLQPQQTIKFNSTSLNLIEFVVWLAGPFFSNSITPLNSNSNQTFLICLWLRVDWMELTNQLTITHSIQNKLNFFSLCLIGEWVSCCRPPSNWFHQFVLRLVQPKQLKPNQTISFILKEWNEIDFGLLLRLAPTHSIKNNNLLYCF